MCNFEEHRCDFFRFITSYATCNSSLYFYYMCAFLQEGRLKGLKIIHNLFSQLFLVGVIEVTLHLQIHYKMSNNKLQVVLLDEAIEFI